MKAKEIMTGDIVRIKETGKVIQITVVDASYETVDYFDADAEGELTIEIRKIEPIPLTAEILEKNGFERSSVFVEWKYERNGIYMLWKPFPFLKVETENVQLNLSGCEYVHELQRALRCCGLFDKANDIVV